MNILKTKGHLKNSERVFKYIKAAYVTLERQAEHSTEQDELKEILDELSMLQERVEDYIIETELVIEDAQETLI